MLRRLRSEGHEATLSIKGPRPETVDFMQSPGRAADMEHYRQVYQQIDSDPLLAGRVSFEGWGNDVAIWYRKIDHILSCSDFESFHYALADGVLSGCQPIVWPWDGADRTYRSDWIVADEPAAVERILQWRNLSANERRDRQEANRAFIAGRYGHEKVFGEISRILGLNGD